MKKYASLSIILAFSWQAVAQNCSSERYLSDVFQSSVSQDVVFGNAPAVTAVYVAENVTVNQSMTMDIFFPVGDALPKRPLVMLAYGGGFLVGSKEDEDVWASCDSLAKKGYVTASINYRMNMNIADPSSAIRAIYRAAQDYSAAIRYLKEFSDSYGIDTNYVFVGGVSAGGFSAMHAVFMDDNERPSATFQSGILGSSPDLGCIHCAGNSYQHTTNVRGIINLWGAVLDTTYIQQNEIVPMTLFHGTDDLIVPYDYGFPFTALFLMPEVFGSLNVSARVNHLGGNAELNTYATGHNIWGVNVANQLVGGPTEYWNPITDSIISFLYENIRPAQPLLAVDAPMCSSDTVFIDITNMPANGRACWSVELGDVVWANSDSSTIGVIWQNAGNYQVAVLVSNHLDAVSIPTTIQVQVSETPYVEVEAAGGVLQASATYPQYQWYLNGVAVPGEVQSTIEPSAFGLYTVEAITADGCSFISEPYLMVGIEEAATMGSIASVRIFDALGREVAAFSSYATFLNWKPNIPQLMFVQFFTADGAMIGTKKQLATDPF